MGPSENDQKLMLESLGEDSLDELMKKIVPTNIQVNSLSKLPNPIDEHQMLQELESISKKNKLIRSLIGDGFYQTLMPSVIKRNILENPAWYSAYTPYQPEISQGRLEALFNFQTLIVELTGLPIANASLLDEGSACAEAMILSQRACKSNRKRFYIADNLFNHCKNVLITRALPLDIELVPFEAKQKMLTFIDAFGVIAPYIGADGEVSDISQINKATKDANIPLTITADPLSLILLESPGKLGADICLGNTQRFGIPMGFGGPHAAFFSVIEKYKRLLPGRLIGKSIDSEGRSGFRLTLQTREQHIRRDKATSNICTAQALLANLASFYAIYHGPKGLKLIANRIHKLTCLLATSLEVSGYKINKTFFDTLSISVNDSKKVIKKFLKAGFNLKEIDTRTVKLSLDEASTKKEVKCLIKLFDAKIIEKEYSTNERLPRPYLRKSSFLTQPIFNEFVSETEIMRYMRRLGDRDLALDRTMIPLGSCTMKLNAASEMIPISWDHLSNLHPFCPQSQAKGFKKIEQDLCNWISQITGLPGVYLAPNSGAQGELAGLLAIRAYQQSIGQEQRNICLIPSSSHGTNPASAIVAGLRVIIIKCDAEGDIDLDDLRKNVSQYGNQLACFMVTYPSTHGVFEETVKIACEIIHKTGGQVYMDGANLNAQIGLTNPGYIGFDVAHLNLHKTFCIPHGGGGPGIGPIVMEKHLIPFIPGNSKNSVGLITSAPLGSALLLAIPWAYIKMMGAHGLSLATKNAILNSNYIAKRLAGEYRILYSGKHGWVAHECIVDIRPITKETGVTVEDIAKRLIDFGFHAPTMSWPVPGTFMIEPTESESLIEIDRFCNAMIEIRKEIREIERNQLSYAESTLAQAPFTMRMVTEQEWPHKFSRKKAAFPGNVSQVDRYWPPNSRIDNAYGDRNLVCSCEAIDIQKFTLVS